MQRPSWRLHVTSCVQVVGDLDAWAGAVALPLDKVTESALHGRRLQLPVRPFAKEIQQF